MDCLREGWLVRKTIYSTILVKGKRRAFRMDMVSGLVGWTFDDFDDYGIFFMTFVFYGWGGFGGLFP